MLSIKQEKHHNILLYVILVTLLSKDTSNAVCIDNFNENKITNQEDYVNSSKQLSFEDKLNNKDITNKYLQKLEHNIKIEIQAPNNILNNTIQSINPTEVPSLNNKIQLSNKSEYPDYTMDYILKLLWDNYNYLYNHDNFPKSDILKDNNNIIKHNITILKEQENSLILQITKFNNKKKLNQQRLIAEMNKIKNDKYLSNEAKKIILVQLLEPEKCKFSNNIDKVLVIKNQYENLNYFINLNDTYFKMQELLSKHDPCTIFIMNNDEKIILNQLKLCNKIIYENINSFYDACLLWNYPEETNDKLNIINNTISILLNEPKDIEYNLKTINAKISEIEKSPILKTIKNDLQTIHDKLSNISLTIEVQHAKNSMHNTIEKTSNLLNNINIRNTRNSFHNFDNNKVIMPTTNNIMCWCEENYEDWEGELCDYEQKITDRFKFKLSKNQITKQDLNDAFHALYKIATTYARVENYHRTAAMLHNLYPLCKSNQPIILPSIFAV